MTDKETLAEKISQKISSGEVEMRSRRYFLARGALVAVGAALAFLLALYLTSFALFSLRASGAWHLPGFGLRGMIPFLASFPWLLVLLAVAFIFILELFLKKHTAAYRKPLLYSALGAIALVVALGFLMHTRAPFPMHAKNARPHHLLHSGMIASPPNAEGFQLKKESDELWQVMIGPKTRIPREVVLMEGQEVGVMGPAQDGVIEAHGIRPGEIKRPPFGSSKRKVGNMFLNQK